MQQDKPIKVYSKREAWMRRGIYCGLIIIVFILIPFILNGVGYLVAGEDWTDFSQTLFGQSGSAQTFLTGFAVTC